MTGCAAAASRIASSDRTSAAVSSPYPLFTSAVVVPWSSISSRRERIAAASSSRDAFRVASTLRTIPPPAAAISR